MHPARRPPSRPCRRRSSSGGGFTLIELMVVIGIIVLLAAILLPVVSRVRQTAYDTSTQQQMARIMQACQQYFHDNNAYPGPVANGNLSGGLNPISPPTEFTNATANNGATGITSSENLVLGLLGYLDPRSPTAPVATLPTFNNGGQGPTLPPGPPPHDVLSLNPLRPAKYSYIDYSPGELSGGSAGLLESMTNLTIKDSNIPEFIDRFPNPMPILYLRANVGATGTPQAFNQDVSGGALVQYNYMELASYGCNVTFSDGNIKALPLDDKYFTTLSATSPSPVTDTKPYLDWNGITPVSGSNPPSYNGYLTNPNIGGGGATGGAVRGKDGFILISAGKDRVYGTLDDTIVTP